MQYTQTTENIIKDSNGNIIDFNIILEQYQSLQKVVQTQEANIQSIVTIVTTIYNELPNSVPQNIIDAFQLTPPAN